MKIISQHRALVALAVAGLAVTAAQAQTGFQEAQWLWNPIEAVGEAVPPLPPASVYPVQLLLDDDSSDGGFGVASGQNARQFLWFNQFTPATGFHLEQVWVLFPSGANMTVGGAVQIAIYGRARKIPRVHWTFAHVASSGSSAGRKRGDEPELPLEPS
jgi:hypothetical protein